jgi:hypothetical protein
VADPEETFREVMPLTSERDIDLVAWLVGMIRGAWESDRTCHQKGRTAVCPHTRGLGRARWPGAKAAVLGPLTVPQEAG